MTNILGFNLCQTCCFQVGRTVKHVEQVFEYQSPTLSLILSQAERFQELEHQYEGDSRLVVAMTFHSLEKLELLVMLRSVAYC